VNFAADGSIRLIPLHQPLVVAVGADGLIRLVAGDGEFGDDGDGGPATSARFGEIGAMALAPDGTLYLADHAFFRIRVVRPDGTVHPYAGSSVPGFLDGPAAEAQFASIDGLALAPDGTLYVADAANGMIRRVLPSGTVDTFAGTGAFGFAGDGGPALDATFNAPQGVALDADGTVYVSDTNNNRLRRVDPAGTIATIAGNGEGALAGDGGPALAASLNGPFGLTVDGDTLLVGDLFNSCARAIRLR
jgi:serine/threonine-protein kinase